jgi:hypothetical protein
VGEGSEPSAIFGALAHEAFALGGAAQTARGLNALRLPQTAAVVLAVRLAQGLAVNVCVWWLGTRLRLASSRFAAEVICARVPAGVECRAKHANDDPDRTSAAHAEPQSKERSRTLDASDDARRQRKTPVFALHCESDASLCSKRCRSFLACARRPLASAICCRTSVVRAAQREVRFKVYRPRAQ